MKATDKALTHVVHKAQQLGLVAPFQLKQWEWWWQETSCEDPISVITMSVMLDSARGRRQIAAGYDLPLSRATPERLLAHELGHAFQWHWASERRVKPLKGYGKAFPRNDRFEDPWNDLLDYMDEHPDFEYDRSRFISLYAWSDRDEDFADTFAEVVCRRGRIESYRNRPEVYLKMQAILRAGRKVLRSDAVLRKCNRNGWDYLFGGDLRFKCPNLGTWYGVPLLVDDYIWVYPDFPTQKMRVLG